MWDNPFLMQRISRILRLASVIFMLAYGVHMAMNHSAHIDRVEILGAHHPQTLTAIPGLVARMSGGFFSLDLEQTRADFEAQPWVKSVTVARIWPDRLVIRLDEHVPAAAWNDLAVMSTRGHVFPAVPWKDLPKVYAPEGMEYEVAAQMGQFARLLAPYHWRVQRIAIDALGSWSIGLDQGAGHGATLILGREQTAERLARFLRYLPQITQAGQPAGKAFMQVDLRYPNGFAVAHGTPKPPAGNKT